MPELMITLPFPPSVNTYWRNTKRGTLVSAKGRIFRANAIAAVYEQLKRRPKAIESDVFVSVKLYPPTKQARDIDNFLKAPLMRLLMPVYGLMINRLKKWMLNGWTLLKAGSLK